MKNLNYKRIILIATYLALAGFSCFWTAESLYIWQPNLTIYGAWLIAIVFYFIASLCFGNILLALNPKTNYRGKLFGRGGQLALSVVGLIVFWAISLATNTHTLLYRASIKDVIKPDLTTTLYYLQGLKSNNVEINRVNKKYNDKDAAVKSYVNRMVTETRNPSALGIGHRFETILVEAENELGIKVQRVARYGNTPSEWLTAVNYYHAQFLEHLKIVRAECDKEIDGIKELMKSNKLSGLITNCETALKDIQNMRGVNNDIVAAAVSDLEDGYAFIKANSKYISFEDSDKGKADQKRYLRDGAIPDAKSMLSVPDVLKDYFTTDKFNGHGFIWWIFIALLVDLSAFIIFTKIK